MEAAAAPAIYGVDFTSAPRRAKPITVALLRPTAPDRYALVGVESLVDWGAFDAFLRRPGPWVAGFDMPFGLPRALVEALDWPREWRTLMRHYASLDRATIRATFMRYCAARPIGSKFAHRATDRPAGSSTSMKWVNPPVAWMLHAGIPRLMDAGVCIPGLDDRIERTAGAGSAAVDPGRVALEAYPGYLARSITRASYKSDTRAMQTGARRDQRARIVAALESGDHAMSRPPPDASADASRDLFHVTIDDRQAASLIDDGSADRLDAVLCAVEAAWAVRQHDDGHSRYGLPDDIDPLEGWIVGVRPLVQPVVRPPAQAPAQPLAQTHAKPLVTTDATAGSARDAMAAPVR